MKEKKKWGMKNSGIGKKTSNKFPMIIISYSSTWFYQIKDRKINSSLDKKKDKKTYDERLSAALLKMSKRVVFLDEGIVVVTEDDQPLTHEEVLELDIAGDLSSNTNGVHDEQNLAGNVDFDEVAVALGAVEALGVGAHRLERLRHVHEVSVSAPRGYQLESYK